MNITESIYKLQATPCTSHDASELLTLNEAFRAHVVHTYSDFASCGNFAFSKRVSKLRGANIEMDNTFGISLARCRVLKPGSVNTRGIATS